MLRSVLAAGMIAGSLIAFSPIATAAVVAPSGLKSVADQQGNVIEVRRRGGHRGFRRGGFSKHKSFIYGALPFISYGAYSYGYYGSSCSSLWRRYRYTGSRY